METLTYAAIAFVVLLVLFILFQRSPADDVAQRLRREGYEPTSTQLQPRTDGVVRVLFWARDPEGDDVRGVAIIEGRDIVLEFDKR